MIGLLITVIVVSMICGLLLWAIANLPFIPAPMAQILRVVIIVVACIWLISVLLGGVGGIHGLGWGHGAVVSVR
jgi:hypothetical protein